MNDNPLSPNFYNGTFIVSNFSETAKLE